MTTPERNLFSPRTLTPSATTILRHAPAPPRAEMLAKTSSMSRVEGCVLGAEGRRGGGGEGDDGGSGRGGGDGGGGGLTRGMHRRRRRTTDATATVRARCRRRVWSCAPDGGGGEDDGQEVPELGGARVPRGGRVVRRGHRAARAGRCAASVFRLGTRRVSSPSARASSIIRAAGAHRSLPCRILG